MLIRTPMHFTTFHSVLALLGLALPGSLSAQTTMRAASPPTWSSQVTRAAPGAFPELEPCKLVFDLSWNNLISAGTAEVTLKRAGPMQLAEGRAGTMGFARRLWRYDCEMSSVMQRGSLQARHMAHSETDDRETISYQVSFSPTQVRTQSLLTPTRGEERKSSFICPYGPVDDLQSAILYVRSQSLKTGDAITRVVQPFDRPYLTTFTVTGREKRTVRGTAYDTIKLDVMIRKIDRKTLQLGSFKKMRQATIWVSDDAWRLPVEAHADIFVGFISAAMTKRQALTGKDAVADLPKSMTR